MRSSSAPCGQQRRETFNKLKSFHLFPLAQVQLDFAQQLRVRALLIHHPIIGATPDEGQGQREHQGSDDQQDQDNQDDQQDNPHQDDDRVGGREQTTGNDDGGGGDEDPDDEGENDGDDAQDEDEEEEEEETGEFQEARSHASDEEEPTSEQVAKNLQGKKSVKEKKQKRQ